MDAICQESISRYFDLLESALRENQLEDCPGQIYNMVETGMPLDPRAPNIMQNLDKKGKLQAVRQKGAKNSYWLWQRNWSVHSSNGDF